MINFGHGHGGRSSPNFNFHNQSRHYGGKWMPKPNLEFNFIELHGNSMNKP